MGAINQMRDEAQAPVADEAPVAPPDEGTADTAPDAAPEGGEAAPEGEASGGGEWPSSLPEDQQDTLEAALNLVQTVLYKNPKTSKAVLDQLVEGPENHMQAQAVGRAALLLIQQVNQRIPLQPEVAMYLAPAVVNRLVELAERVKKIKFSEEDLMVAFQGVAQGVSAVFKSGGAPAAEQGVAAPAEQAPPEPAQAAPPAEVPA